MNRRLAMFLLAVPLLLLSSTPAASIAQDGQAPASNTVQSERGIQIIWEADAPPPDINNVLRRLFGPEVAGAAAKRILGVEPKDVATLIQRVPPLEMKEHSCSFSFAVSVDPTGAGGRRATKEFADELVNELGRLLAEDRRRVTEERAKRVMEEVRELDFNLDAIRRRIKEKRELVLDKANRPDLQSLTAGMAKLEDDRQRLEVDLAGMEARLAAVQEQIARASEEAKKQAADDPVLAELEKAVAARQKLMDVTRKLYESGQASFSDVTVAEAALIDARINGLDRRGTASAKGADALTPLTRDLQNVSIELRDRKARLQLVEQQLKPLRAVAREFLDLEGMQEEAAALRRSWEDANERLRHARREADAAPVDRVVVTHAPDTVAPEKAPPAKR